MENQKEHLTASRDFHYLVVGTKNDVAHAWTVIGVFLAFRIRIVQITVDSFVICTGGRALRRLR